MRTISSVAAMLPLLATLVATTTVSAQQDLPPGPTAGGDELPALRTPIHGAEDRGGQRYGTWGAGETYKASFHDGMTFVPYLGADYPHNQPWSWRTESVRLGSTELLENGVPPRHVQQDFRYEYRHGAVTEAYDVLLEGLEQTFVVHQLPAAGDLVITGAVASQLCSRPVAAAHQALVFADAEGRAIVGYGHAFAIDARGERTPITTAHADGVITLTVPGPWLQQAALPVTVDPLLTRVVVAIAGGGAYAGEVDIARDDVALTDNVMVVFSRATSATDWDVYCRLCDDNYSGATTVFSDVASNAISDHPSCAFVGGANRWLIAYRRYYPGGRSLLWFHYRNSGDASFHTTSSSLWNIGPYFNDWRPDVGGVASYQLGGRALIVFQREINLSNNNNFANTSFSDVWGVLYDLSTTPPTLGSEFVIMGCSTCIDDRDHERPSVNKVAEGGAAFSWVCVAQSYDSNDPPARWTLPGVRIRHDGSLAPAVWHSDFEAAATHHTVGPIVEGSNGRYAVTFAATDLASTPYKIGDTYGKALYVERFDWANSASAPDGDRPPMLVRSSADRRWEATGLGFDTEDASHFAVGYRAVAPGVPSAYYSRVGYRGQVTEGPNTLLYYAAGHSTTGPVCVYDDDHDDFLFAYGVRNGVTEPIYGHTLEYATPAPWSTSGIGCSLANISWIGNQQIGAERNRVSVSGAGGQSAHFLLVSMQSTSLPVNVGGVLHGCYLLVDATGPGYLGTMPLALGANVSWPFPMPEWLTPGALRFQDWILDNNTLASTQRLTVPMIK